MAESANEPNVNVGVIRTMVKNRLLAARQAAKGAPWMIQREDLHRACLAKPVFRTGGKGSLERKPKSQAKFDKTIVLPNQCVAAIFRF
jgi:hypothetical protein